MWQRTGIAGLGSGRQRRTLGGRKMQVGGSATKQPVVCEQAACKKGCPWVAISKDWSTWRLCREGTLE